MNSNVIKNKRNGAKNSNVLESLQPIVKVKKEPTKRTKDRREINKDIRVKLLNFTQVFKQVRADYLLLPNRVTQKHINESNIYLTEFLKQHCSESLSKKLNDKFYLDRLAILTTDIKALKCFITKKQLENFTSKQWSAAEIIDVMVKAITLSGQDYQACLALKGKI